MGISSYYDWGRTFAYDAPMTMVVGVRDVGKTYGLRKQLVNDFLKDGARFVQLVRYKTELPIMSGEYLAKVGREFPGHMFKTDNRFAWCAERVPDGEKPDWRCMGYFCALTQMQQIKSTTFVDPYRIVLDEAIIDPALQRYTSYLPREYYVLTQAIDSITREQVDEDGNAVPRKHQPRVYLLANGLSMANPYFHLLGIRKPPPFGKHWYMDSDGRKTVLLDYVEPRRQDKRRKSTTVAGRLSAMDPTSAGALDNEFLDASGLFVAEKPRRAKPAFAIAHQGRRYGVWEDRGEGMVYVTDGAPANIDPVYALTNKEGEFNAFLAARNEPVMRYLVEMYRYGLVRVDCDGTRAALGECLGMFGLR